MATVGQDQYAHAGIEPRPQHIQLVIEQLPVVQAPGLVLAVFLIAVHVLYLAAVAGKGKKKEEELRMNLQKTVERDVKVYLILDKIAETENIQFKEGESLPMKVMEFLLKEASWEDSKQK